MTELFAEEFDTSLLVGKSAQGDISRFYQNSEIPPGKQLVYIYVNDDWKGKFEVNIGEKIKILVLMLRMLKIRFKNSISYKTDD